LADFVGNNAAGQRERKKIVRREVIEHYGGKCECCGEEHMEFLSIDHVKGGGTKERRDNNKRGDCFAARARNDIKGNVWGKFVVT